MMIASGDAELAVFRCPECSSSLKLSSDSAAEWVCLTGEHRFPVRDGIVSFVPGAADFEAHWQRHQSAEIPAVKIGEARAFLRPLASATPARTLDAGCGDGVHAKVGQDEHELGLYYALDISAAALRLTRFRAREGPVLVQASVSKLPFADESFDAVFSFGVLAYTEDPRASLLELARVVKPGGQLGVWFFPRQHGLRRFAFEGVRALCAVLGATGTQMLANTLVPLLTVLPTRSGISLKNATWAQCREIIMVNIAPAQLHFPTRADVLDWFREAGVDVETEDPERPITVWGRKCTNP